MQTCAILVMCVPGVLTAMASMLPRFDWSINFGHLLTVVSVLLAAVAYLSRFREEQRIHTLQIKGIEAWIKRHDEALRDNLAILQELRTQSALATKMLETLLVRVERLEAR